MPIESVNALFLLLCVFQFKHYLADFPLQTTYMLDKKSQTWSFILPLAAHCLVHSGLSLFVILIVNPSLWWLFFVDFSLHFIMDRFKAAPQFLGRVEKNQAKLYWGIFGFDQMFHHLTNYLILYYIVTTPGSTLGNWSLTLINWVK